MSTATASEPSFLHELPALSALPVEHLADFSVDLEPAQVLTTPLGTRMTFVVKRGRVSGPRLRGEILPGGGDWVVVGSDAIGRLDVRATLRTDDGALIHTTVGGVAQLPADGMRRLAAGDRLPWGETYVRTTPRFETGDERYAWLNEVVSVAYNELSKDHIDYRIYRVR
ncbi:MAG TPA: DUF3237 domain-containing protein [Actinomycetota bacterium]|nr:DUF3237 domain-containing protein [Actinomycetota bacterium]